MISLQNVSKALGGRLALSNVTLEIPRGSVFGLLGHNGAGKSTAIGIILGQILPDDGTVLVNGFDVSRERAKALARLGAIYETPAFYDYLTGERNLRIFCEYSARTDLVRLAEVVQMVGLTSRIGDKVRVYSHGMRQRLAIAQALLPGPDVLILDEPTEGLDPEGIFETRQLIQKLHREWGLTILVSSHQLSEMEQVCTHLAVLHQGRVRFSGDWRAVCSHERLIIEVDRQEHAREDLANAGLVRWFETETVARLQPGISIATVAEWLVHRGYAISQIRRHEMSLENFYLETIHAGDRNLSP